MVYSVTLMSHCRFHAPHWHIIRSNQVWFKPINRLLIFRVVIEVKGHVHRKNASIYKGVRLPDNLNEMMKQSGMDTCRHRIMKTIKLNCGIAIGM